MNDDLDDLGAPAEPSRPWHERAACRGYDPDLFYPAMGNRPGLAASTVAQIRAAKAVCAQCPVRQECADAGRYEPFGIWGGLTADERNRVDRRTLRQPINHGTDAGYRLHRQRGEEPCDDCRRAHTFDVLERRPSRARSIA